MMETKFESIYEERRLVARGMHAYGGSFVRHLGAALLHADGQNALKIKETWPEEWNNYLKAGIALEKGESKGGETDDS